MLDIWIYSRNHPNSALSFVYLFCVFAITVNLLKLLCSSFEMPGAPPQKKKKSRRGEKIGHS